MLSFEVCQKCCYPTDPTMITKFPVYCQAKYPHGADGYMVADYEDPPKKCPRRLEHAVALAMSTKG